ncbi:hypothetical protein KP806_07670 [Paenibacillus sp. N4]|uniref:hypothetical protein n=1 Tax=Paenibacillus vietnamensis TaxID=2590547 RepID=UPI001CD07A4C|nr:hypothetical protein [Paenibacillus vietnamensis]MCA0754925.1 hypothetical protein [Paenibacillus vietnamensis]
MTKYKIINIPTINDDIRDFQNLFHIYSQVLFSDTNILFNFSSCRFLRQNAVAFIGGLARLIRYNGHRVMFDWDSLTSRIATNLKQNGFIESFDFFGDSPWEGNSVRYREDKIAKKEAYIEYLSNDWLGRGWINVSKPLKNEIVGKVWEIYINSFDHGNSPIGVFTCGQRYPYLDELRLCLVDFGIGIPNSVRRFKNDNSIKASNAMKWAFRPGATTKPEDEDGNESGRGLGLDLLSKFIKINKGTLEVFSHEGYAKITADKEEYKNIPYKYNGTLVNISLKCDDETFYYLSSE